MSHWGALIDPQSVLPKSPVAGVKYSPLDAREPKPMKEVVPPPTVAEIDALRADNEVRRRMESLPAPAMRDQPEAAGPTENDRCTEEPQVVQEQPCVVVAMSGTPPADMIEGSEIKTGIQSTGYIPRFGSLGWRVVKYLRNNRNTRLTRKQVAAQFMSAENGVDKGLQPCVAAGLLVHVRGENRLMVWGAGDNDAALPTATKPKPTPPPKPPAESPAPAAAEAIEFNATLWLDGNLVIYGAIETEDGGVLIKKDQLDKLKRLITWSGV